MKERLDSFISILVQSDFGVPYALRIDMRKLASMLIGIFCSFFFLLLGSLAFFRELELNRKLQERVLELEVQEKLSSQLPQSVISQRIASAAEHIRGLSTNSQKAKPISGEKGNKASSIDKKVKQVEPKLNLKPGVAPGAGRVAPKTRVVAQAKVPPVQASIIKTRALAKVRPKLGALSISCLKGECITRVRLLPSSPGLAQGELILVLETEVLRIGEATHTADIKKRFFIYPGYETKDELNPESINKLKGKAFEFSKALRTLASFQIGKLQKPIAINAYLFDENHDLLQHERRIIKIE